MSVQESVYYFIPELWLTKTFLRVIYAINNLLRMKMILSEK